MSTMVNAPTGTGSLSDEVLGPMRKRLDSRRPRTSASASDLPGRRDLPAALPRASANQDLGIADGPSQSDLQRWFSASNLHASSSAAPSRRPATVGSQRSVSLTHQLGTRLVPSKYDACIKPSLYRVQQADERILAEHAASGGHWRDLPVEVVRRQRGFPEPPAAVGAHGDDSEAVVWWKAPKENGPPVTAYTELRASGG